MKPLDQYPTPETDWLCERIGDPPYAMNPRTNLCRDLEHRNAALREYLQKLYDAQGSCIDLTPELLTECWIILTLTAPKQGRVPRILDALLANRTRHTN
jgi:hypothetical protein